VAGFTGTISLGCGGVSYSISCTISPTSVTITGSSPANATLTVNTGAASGATPPTLDRKAPPGPGISLFPWFWVLAGLLVLATLVTLGTRRRSAAWLFATPLLVAGAWAACGGGAGGGGGSSTPPAAPAASFSPSTLSFGNQALGTVSAQRSLTLTNTGNAVLAIAGVYVYPIGGPDFNAYNGCNSTPNLAPGANCSILVTFSPTLAGSRSGSIAVADNAPGSPQSVTLTGVGALQPTSPGTYSIQVQATSGSDYHYPNVSVTVQ